MDSEDAILYESDKVGCQKFHPTVSEGGYGWIVVISGFLVQFVTLGFINNVGSLNVIWLLDFKLTQGQVSWVGSLTMGIMFVSGPIVTLLIEHLGCQMVSIIGSLFCITGIIACSFVKDFYLLLVCFGLILGFGVSCAYFSSVLIQTKYFSKRLPLANGIVSAGSGAGTMVISTFASKLYSIVGWRMGIRYACIPFLLNIIFSLFYNDFCSKFNFRNLNCFTQKTKSRRSVPISPWFVIGSSLKNLCPIYLLFNLKYFVFTVSCIVFMLGYFVPYIHIINFALTKNINYSNASLLIGIISIFSLTGKILSGKIAEFQFSCPVMLMTICFFFIGISNIFVTLSTEYWHFIIYSVVFGLFEGGYVALVAIVLDKIIGKKNLGPGIGLLFAIKAVPLLFGAPLAGMIYDSTKSFIIPFVIAGSFSVISCLLLFIINFYLLIDNRQQINMSRIEIYSNDDTDQEEDKNYQYDLSRIENFNQVLLKHSKNCSISSKNSYNKTHEASVLKKEYAKTHLETEV